MKKILRLVTTSVLTLTLVACGGQSSASSQPSTQSSSSTGTTTSSSSSAYAAVSSVSISAASSLLEQVSTSIKKVTVSATLNANTNPNTAIEWYIDGAKSIQSGKIFEFTPSGVGSFQVVAKVGSVSSNTIEVRVSAPEAVIAIESVKVIDADTIEVKGSEGATIEIVGKTLKDQSYYDFIAKKYVLDVKEAIAQGDKLTVKLSKDGASKTFEYTYDTRAVTASLTLASDATLNADGSYTVVKPYAAASETIKTYSIEAESLNVLGTNIEYRVSTVVPSGAAAINDKTSLLTPDAAKYEIEASSFSVTASTVVGDYTHKISFGTKTDEVVVHVVEPTTSIVVNPVYNVVDDPATVAVEKFAVAYAAEGIEANADGSYSITKPYETDASYEPVTFAFKGKYFEKDQYIPSTYTVAITGPSLYSGENAALMTGIETELNGTSIAANNTNITGLQYKNFVADNGTGFEAAIDQKITRNTPVGTYKFVVSATTASGKEYKQELVLHVEAPATSLESVMTVVAEEDPTTPAAIDKLANGRAVEYAFDEATNTYTFAKPIGANSYIYDIGVVLSNWQNPKASTDEVVVDQTSLLTYADFQGKTYNLKALRAAEAVGKKYMGTHDILLTYSAGDYVVDSGVYYKALKAGILGALTVATDWDKLDDPVADAAELAEVAKARAYQAANIAIFAESPSTNEDVMSFAQYTWKVDSPAIGSSIVNGKIAIDLKVDDSDMVVYAAGYTQTTKTDYNALGDYFVVKSDTVTGTYSYTYTIEHNGEAFTTTINVKIQNPTPKVFVLSGEDTILGAGTPVTPGMVSSTGGEDYQCIDVNGVAYPSEDGVYEIDVNKLDGTDAMKATIGIADLAAGTYAYSVSKEYPDATKNVTSNGQIIIEQADIAANGYINLATVEDVQEGSLPFSAAWKIDENSLIEGTYKYTFTINGVSKVVSVTFGDYDEKLVVKSAKVGTVDLAKFGSAYIYKAPINGTVKTATLKLSSVNFEDGKDLWISHAIEGNGTIAVALVNGTVKTSADLKKVVFDEDGYFEYEITFASAASLGKFDTAYETLVNQIKYYVYETDSTNDGQVVQVIDAGGTVTINAVCLDADGYISNLNPA